jgi:hypothetical protein
MVAGVGSVDLGHDLPGHLRDGESLNGLLDDVHLNRVHAGDVVHDDSDGATVRGYDRAPLAVRELTGKGCQQGGALVDAIGELVGSGRHGPLGECMVKPAAKE